jgi:hypothetical protein
MSEPLSSLDAVLTEIADERARQDAKWGEQNHPLISLGLDGIHRRCDERGVTCGYANREDIDNAKDRMAAGEMPRSVCEWGRPGRGWWEQGF